MICFPRTGHDGRIIARTPAAVTRRILPRGATFGLAVLSGAFVAFSLPPFGWWPLGAVGLGGFALLLSGTAGAPAPIRARAAIGVGVGLGQFAIGLSWVTEFHVAGYVGLIVHGMAATALAGALVPARRRLGVLWGLPAAVVLAEWIRSHFPAGGLPIGGAALGQAAGPLAPTVRLGGSLLLVGVLALAGAGLAEIAAACLAGRRTPGRATAHKARLTRGILAVAVVVVVVAVARIGPDGSGPGPHLPLRVAAVQGGGERGLRAVDTDPGLVTQRQLDASASLRPPLDLVVWPEDVVHVGGPVRDTAEGAAIAALAARLHATVEAGVVTDVGLDRFRNAAVAWSPEGTIVASYDKVHRVPFGEYVPGRSLIKHLASLSHVPADAIPGRGPGLLLTPAGPLGVVISYELFFDERARDAIHAGGEVLLVPTNAASYRSTQVPTQEVAATRLRALETGRDAVQASPTGYSALVGHDGRVRSHSVLGRRQVLLGTIERRTGQTIFVRFGDLPVLLLAMAGLAAAAVVARPRRGRSRPETADRPAGESSSQAGAPPATPSEVRADR